MENLPNIITAILPCFRLNMGTGTLSKGKNKPLRSEVSADIEDEYFSDSTYKSLESTIKSSIGELIKENMSPNQEQCQKSNCSNQEKRVEEIQLSSNVSIKRISVPKLNLGNNKTKIYASVDKTQYNFDTSFESKASDLASNSFAIKKNIVVPKLNIINGNIVKKVSKINYDKSFINESNRTCESSKNKMEECIPKISSIRDKDQKSSKTYSSQRSVTMFIRIYKLIFQCLNVKM